MKIDLERKCTATHDWEQVATFRYFIDAEATARLLSKLDGVTYRVLDNRWPDEGVEVTLYANGEIEA